MGVANSSGEAEGMISDELWGLFVLIKVLELGYRKLSVQLLYSEMKDCKNRRE